MEELTIDNVGRRFTNLINELNLITNFCNENRIKLNISPVDFNPYNQLFNISSKSKDIFTGTLVLKYEKDLLNG